VAVAVAPNLVGPLQNENLAAPLRFSLVFLTGVVLHEFKERVPMRWPAAVVSLALVAGTEILMDGNYRLVAIVPLAYLLVWCSARLPFRFGSRNDLSYGVFLFGFPIQQTLVMLGVPAAGWLIFVAASVLVAVPLAALSWFGIEKPMMRLREVRLPIRRYTGDDGPTSRFRGLALTTVLLVTYIASSHLPMIG